MKKKRCERCHRKSAVRKGRFCSDCKKLVKSEMEGTGFLQATPRDRGYRSNEMQENTYETKRGGNR